MPDAARNLLALDAAHGPARAAILRADGASFQAETPADRPHSRAIMPMLERLLADAGLDWRKLRLLAAGIGPGSFTGVRMAAAIIAGINASLKLPVLPLSSLAVTAWRTDCREALRVIEDARAGLYWLGCYRDGEALEPDASIEREPLSARQPGRMASETLVEHDLPGWQRQPFVRTRAEALGLLARHAMERMPRPDTLPRFITPAYLCPSQAERNAARA